MRFSYVLGIWIILSFELSQLQESNITGMFQIRYPLFLRPCLRCDFDINRDPFNLHQTFLNESQASGFLPATLKLFPAKAKVSIISDHVFLMDLSTSPAVQSIAYAGTRITKGTKSEAYRRLYQCSFPACTTSTPSLQIFFASSRGVPVATICCSTASGKQ